MTPSLDFEALLKKQAEDFKKSIPSKVFFNHFYALSYHIAENESKYKLKEVDYYNKIKIQNTDFQPDTAKKLLWNSWSTEYAFNITSAVSNSGYYKFALHWYFPQAYYSIYLAMTAFHETQGTANDQHEKSIKTFGNQVANGHYPKSISFYAHGLYNGLEIKGLDHLKTDPDFNSLQRIESIEDAHSQIASFLKSTREQNAWNKRKRGESQHKKDKRFQNAKGDLVGAFRKKHWDIIYSSIPQTTILNMLYRLRIKANYHDIQAFVDADIDFKAFHDCLGSIISYMNFVHEAYLHKAIGDEAYKEILDGFNHHVIELGAKKRYYDIIVNI